MQKLRLTGPARCLPLLTVLTLATSQLAAGDWPQILGPNRNGISADEVIKPWPKAGPRGLWSKGVGDGTAGLAVSPEVDGREQLAILFHRVGNEEVVEALSVGEGERQWRDGYRTDFVSQVGESNGPLCVPTIADGRVITFGAQGVLSCLDLATGELQWRRDTHEMFGAREGYFGAGSSPAVSDGRVIAVVGGGNRNAGVVAFDLRNGETLWTAVSDGPSYSSPIVRTVDGRPRVIALTRTKCVLLDPADGTVHGELRFGQRGPTVTGAQPILLDESMLFLTASYGTGAVLARVAPDRIDELWRRDDLLSSQYTTPIARDGLLYGIDGREDIPPADLVCVDPQIRRVLWREPGFGYATLIQAGEHTLIVKTDGELVLARLTKQGAEIVATAKPFRQATRALPALSNGRLFLRDSETLKCLRLD